MAVFWLSPTTYTVNEGVGDAMVMVECTNGTLTFDIEVDFETVVAGSTATGKSQVVCLTNIIIINVAMPNITHCLL